MVVGKWNIRAGGVRFAMEMGTGRISVMKPRKSPWEKEEEIVGGVGQTLHVSGILTKLKKN